MTWRNEQSGPTQLDEIRDLMLAATARNNWLTLAEIAGLTEIGEASISAQLRHLRKRRHGRYRVEKRRRLLFAQGPAAQGDAGAETSAEAPWEYGVYAPLDLGDSQLTGDGGDAHPDLPLAISFDVAFSQDAAADAVRAAAEEEAGDR